jgi:hypothetical protein
MSKSAQDYISHNDFEGALKRYEEASGRWKPHWFATCETIYNSCTEWVSKYIIDPIAKTITKVVKAIRSKIVSVSNPCTYLIKMYDTDNNFVYVKIGKADNLKRRMGQLENYTYLRENTQIGRIEVVKTWEFANNDLAASFESFIHSKIKELYPKIRHIPNDRFDISLNVDEISPKIDNYYTIFTKMIAT